MTAKILQYPLRQDQTTQYVGNDGIMRFAYIVDYVHDGEPCALTVWATDEDDATQHLDSLAFTARLRCKMSDFVAPQRGVRHDPEEDVTTSESDDEGPQPAA